MVLKRMRVLRVLWCVFSEVVRIDSMRLLPKSRGRFWVDGFMTEPQQPTSFLRIFCNI